MAGLFDTRPADRALLAVGFVGATFLLFLSDWPGGFFVENGPLEIAQLACLFLGAIFFLRASRGLPSWPALACLALASICLLGLARETPRCSSPFYAFGPCLSSDYKDLVYVVGAAFPIVMILVNPALRAFRLNVASAAALLRFIPRLLPLLILVPLVGSAQVAEAWHAPVWEESLETTAYALLLYFSLRSISAYQHYRAATTERAAAARLLRTPCR